MSDPTAYGDDASLIVPSCRKDLAPLFLSMKEVYRIESRISEIREANPALLPDLIADFNMGYILIGKMISKVQMELSESQIALKEAKSIVVLDKANQILAEKGHAKSSADLRDHVLMLDPEVVRLTRIVGICEAYIELLNNKAKAMEMAYHGTKKVSEIQGRTPDPNTIGRRY
jgi:hypothetical protein